MTLPGTSDNVASLYYDHKSQTLQTLRGFHFLFHSTPKYSCYTSHLKIDYLILFFASSISNNNKCITIVVTWYKYTKLKVHGDEY
jgi:hypothetical protein